MASLALLKAARLFLTVAYMFLKLFFVLLIVAQTFFAVTFFALMDACPVLSITFSLWAVAQFAKLRQWGQIEYKFRF